MRKWRRKNKDKVAANHRRWRIGPKGKRYKRLPHVALWNVLRCRLRDFGAKPLASMKVIVGCSLSELAAHIESLFRGKMSWRNRGKLWELDHKKPIKWFDQTTLNGQKAAHHFSNWQPLFIVEHRLKTAKDLLRSLRE